jgi:hypothetical protein
MKRIILFAVCLLTYTVSRAQDIPDTHPDARIFAIDYQTGQEYPANSDQAIQFKDAFIDLVRNTYQSRQILRMTPGRKTAIIKQINPQKLNGYQLTWETTMYGQTRAVATFYYNIDENSLYFYDQDEQNWVGVQISAENQYNLDDCRSTAGFNSQQGLPDLSVLPDTTGQGIDEEVTTTEAPPALPEYDQPECPADGYMWQPGYWAFSPIARDYYWVPGVWVAPPAIDLYWTPGYWAFYGGIYRFHVGYWGHTVGFYGGINYGYGYVGIGYVGGEWRSNHFAYNTAVVHVNRVVVHNTYVNNTVINNTIIINNNRTSFNGQGGVTARPTATEQVAMHQQHIMPTHTQIQHQQAALGNRDQFAHENHGRPTFIAMAKVQPTVLNKGNSPAVTSGNRSFGGHQPANNIPNNNGAAGQGNRNFNNGHQPANNNNVPNNNGFGQGSRDFSNRHQPAGNNIPNTSSDGTGNRNFTGHQPVNNEPPQNNGFNPDNRNLNNNQQPANNNTPNKNSYGRDSRNSNNNNRQPVNNEPQNNGYNPANRNLNNNQQPINNTPNTNGYSQGNRNFNGHQPVNNAPQQNNGINPGNRNLNSNQPPANNGHQNNGFNRNNDNFNNNQRPAVNNAPVNNGYNQPNRNSNTGQQQPANQPQNNNRFSPGNRNQGNKPVINNPPVRVQRQQKDGKDGQ